jgi:hypothetical protein
MSEWGKKDFANNEPQYLQTNHPGNTNVYLVNASRLANASFGGGKAVAHQGWVKVNQGTGFVTNITVSNVNTNLVYTNTFLTIAGSNTTPANAKIVVTGGNNVSVVVNVNGKGYGSVPTVTATGTNNSTLIFSVTPGGRMGRVQAETLVVLSDPNVTDANSGGVYFPGA